MGNTAEKLLPDIKAYLHITWAEEDNVIIGYIQRGISRLNRIAGADLDYLAEDLPRQLLFDYCRYANSQALEVFEKNFRQELFDLYLQKRGEEIENQSTN